MLYVEPAKKRGERNGSTPTRGKKNLMVNSKVGVSEKEIDSIDLGRDKISGNVLEMEQVQVRPDKKAKGNSFNIDDTFD